MLSVMAGLLMLIQVSKADNLSDREAITDRRRWKREDNKHEGRGHFMTNRDDTSQTTAAAVDVTRLTMRNW